MKFGIFMFLVVELIKSCLSHPAGGCERESKNDPVAHISRQLSNLEIAPGPRAACALSPLQKRLISQGLQPLVRERRERVVQGPSPSLPSRIPTLVPPGHCRKNITRRRQAHRRSLPSTFCTTTPPEIATWTQRLSQRMWCRC